MARNRDLFDDSTMSFGEHLEVLRVHVWQSLVGLMVGVVVCLFIGNHLVNFLRQPIDDALRRNNMAEITDDVSEVQFLEFVSKWWAGELQDPDEDEPEPEFAQNELLVEVPLDYAVQLIEEAAPGTTAKPVATPDSDSPKTASESSEADEGEGEAAEPPEEPSVKLLIRSDEIALWRATAERFNKPVTLKVEEAFLTYIKVSVVAGFALTSPWIFYQIWLFVAAGLFSHERKYVYRFLPMSLGLFLAGGAFCYYFVMPIVLDFLIGFNSWMGITLQPRLSEYISFILMLPVMFGISFQLPLVMLFIERIGIISVEAYQTNWRMAILVISILSMLLTPSDPQSMLLMMFPLVFLYFGGIMLCRFRPRADVDPLA